MPPTILKALQIVTTHPLLACHFLRALYSTSMWVILSMFLRVGGNEEEETWKCNNPFFILITHRENPSGISLPPVCAGKLLSNKHVHTKTTLLPCNYIYLSGQKEITRHPQTSDPFRGGYLLHYRLEAAFICLRFQS